MADTASDMIRKADMMFRQAVSKESSEDAAAATKWLDKAAAMEADAFALDANAAACSVRRLSA